MRQWAILWDRALAWKTLFRATRIESSSSFVLHLSEGYLRNNVWVDIFGWLFALSRIIWPSGACAALWYCSLCKGDYKTKCNAPHVLHGAPMWIPDIIQYAQLTWQRHNIIDSGWETFRNFKSESALSEGYRNIQVAILSPMFIMQIALSKKYIIRQRQRRQKWMLKVHSIRQDFFQEI